MCRGGDCMCVCICADAGAVCVSTYMQMCSPDVQWEVRGQRSVLSILLSHSPPLFSLLFCLICLFCNRLSLGTWSSLVRIGWLVSGLQDHLSPLHQSWGCKSLTTPSFWHGDLNSDPHSYSASISLTELPPQCKN